MSYKGFDADRLFAAVEVEEVEPMRMQDVDITSLAAELESQEMPEYFSDTLARQGLDLDAQAPAGRVMSQLRPDAHTTQPTVDTEQITPVESPLSDHDDQEDLPVSEVKRWRRAVKIGSVAVAGSAAALTVIFEAGVFGGYVGYQVVEDAKPFSEDSGMDTRDRMADAFDRTVEFNAQIIRDITKGKGE